MARDIGREAGLNYIYVGNVWGEGEDTICPQCGVLLIDREGFAVREEQKLRPVIAPTAGGKLPVSSKNRGHNL